jgi:hypothetical protein
VCESLQVREKAGEIRNLRFQVTHTLYLAESIANVPGSGRAVISGWCSCFGDRQATAPAGFKRFRAIRPDFEYEECFLKVADSNGKDRVQMWAPITADAKGAEHEAQHMAYQVFEFIHGRPVHLFKKEPR